MLVKHGGQVGCMILRGKVRCHARLYKTHIAQLEALHASLRRYLHSRSVQTHGLSYPEASAEFTTMRLRNQPISDFLFNAPSCAAADKKDEATDGETNANRTGGRVAGPFRLFVRRCKQEAGAPSSV